MEVSELKDKKLLLENSIAAVVHDKISVFQDYSETLVTNVSVRIHVKQTIGQIDKAIVSGVTVEIEL